MAVQINKAVIVEDCPHFRELIKIILNSLGASEIIDASNGVEALKVLDSFDADVVIMDRKMDQMDGISCTRHIRTDQQSRNPNLPIVMVSGYGAEEDIRGAYEAGVSSYLVKPISLKPLYAGIVKAIEGAAAPGAGGIG